MTVESGASPGIEITVYRELENAEVKYTSIQWFEWYNSAHIYITFY